MKQHGAEQCRTKSTQYSKELTGMVMRQARLEGKFTEHHERALEKIQDALVTNIAACESALDKFQVQIDPAPSLLRRTSFFNKDSLLRCCQSYARRLLDAGPQPQAVAMLSDPVF